MTQSEKALLQVKKTYERKKIVTESKKLKKEQVELDAVKKELEKDLEKDSKVEKKPVVELDENEKSFIDKYIEYSELTLLNSSAEQLTSTFEKALGQNATKAIETLNKKIEERASKIKELAKQLVELKDEIYKETEKARAKATLISLAEQLPVDTPSKAEEKSTANIINNESKKTKK